MNLFILFFCCVAVAITSGAVIPHISTGSTGIAHGALVFVPVVSVRSNNLHLVNGLGELDNAWGLGEEEGQWNHADDEQEEEHRDWNEEEGRWLESEENREQWDEHWPEHTIAKRQVNNKNIKNGPEGRWNKELERYEYFNDNENNGQLNTDGNNWNSGLVSPLSLPSWGFGL